MTYLKLKHCTPWTLVKNQSGSLNLDPRLVTVQGASSATEQEGRIYGKQIL